MQQEKFDEWVKKVKLDPALTPAFFSVMVGHPSADRVLTIAASRSLSAVSLVRLLKQQGMDVSMIESAMTSSVPAAPEGYLPIPQAPRVFAPQGPRKFHRPSQRPAVAADVAVEGDQTPSQEPSKAGRFSGIKDRFTGLFQGSNKKWWIIGGIVLLLVCLLAGYFVYSANSGPKYDLSSAAYPTATVQSADPAFVEQQQPQIVESAPLETAPVVPPSNPLNFKGSIDSRGFLGKVQSLIFVVGLGILAVLIGDIVYRKQWWDGITAVLVAFISIAVLFPVGTVWWIGLFFFLLQLYLVWFAAFQGGRDYSPLAAYFLLVGVFGGLMATQIAAIQNIFVNMSILTVPPVISLGYYFQTMNLVSLAFPLVVYLFVLVGVVMTIVECVRPSGEDRSSRWGSLASAAFGLLIYFVFLHGIGLVPWISFMIALLISAGASSALRSEPAKQFVTPVWGVRSPFDGAMLLAAVILLLLVIFGQQWWLIGVIV